MATKDLQPKIADHMVNALKLGSFRTTFYMILNERAYPPGNDALIKDIDGNIIAAVNSKFKRDIDIEGSGILLSGRTINFARRIGGEVRYHYVSEHWGLGVGRCALQPYRTIAVDPHLIPLGTRVYIPAARGVSLPDGSVHDGFFSAEDVGAAIIGYHIDLFSAEGEKSSYPFERVGIHTNSRIEVFRAGIPDPQGCQTGDFRSGKSLADMVLPQVFNWP